MAATPVPPVVVGVQADDDTIAFRELPAEPLDLIRVDVGCCHLHRGWQVDDDRLRRGRAPFVGDGRTDIHREVELRAREALGRVLEVNVGIGQVTDALLHHRRALHGEVDDPASIHVEDYPPLQFGGGVVEVEDRTRCAVEGFDGPLDQLRPGLAEHLDRHAVGNHAVVDDAADEVEIRLRRRRETHLDLHEPHVEEKFVHAQLLVDVHGIDERLVAVLEIDAAPARRRGQHRAGPTAVWEIHGLERAVLVEWHGAFAAARGDLSLLRVHRANSVSGVRGFRRWADVALSMRYGRLSRQEQQDKARGDREPGSVGVAGCCHIRPLRADRTIAKSPGIGHAPV